MTTVLVAPLVSTVEVGGISVLIADSMLNVFGGVVYNPILAADQGIRNAESLFIDLTAPAALGTPGTSTELMPGQSFLVPPGVSVWANAATSGHNFSGTFTSSYTPQYPPIVVPGQPGTGVGTFPPSGPTGLLNTVPMYLYQEYSDDDDLQGYIEAVNTLQQNFVDTFNALNLPIYTKAPVSGKLLDWVALGIYGMTRPMISSGHLNLVGPINTWGCGITEITPTVDQPIPVLSVSWSSGTATVNLAASVQSTSAGVNDELILSGFAGPPLAVSSLTWAAGLATVTFTNPVGGIDIGDGYRIDLDGFIPSAWNTSVNGTFTATNTFTYSLATNPGTVTTLGTVQFTAWNGIFTGTFSSASVFTFPITTNPGTVTTLGTARSLTVISQLPALNMLGQIGAILGSLANDDTFRRVLTWHFYKGDGKYFSNRWLERRVWRFCYGVDGIPPDPTLASPSIGDTSQISVSHGANRNITIRFVLGNRTVLGGAEVNRFGCNGFGPLLNSTHNYFIPIPLNDLKTTYTTLPSVPFVRVFQEAIAAGILETPAEFDVTVTYP